MQLPALLALTAVLASFATQAAVTDTHRCYVEPGFDYVANDIGNATSSTTDGCCAKCEATSGCKAYSWSDTNGGTCWLKSDTQTKFGVKSAEPISSTILRRLVPPMGLLTALLLVATTGSCAFAALEECVVELGFDYVGNDLSSLLAVDAFECCHHCQKFAAAGCRAYSWTDYQGGTCWLKTGRGTIAVNTNAQSGTISTFRFAETCVLEHGIDYEGGDIAHIQAGDAGDCCSICEQIPGCRAFTFTTNRGEGGTCWLKSAKGKMVLDPAAVSSQPYEEEPTCGLEQGVEYVGNDVGSTRAGDANECCALCEAFGGCRAFSWSAYKGGTCWFKNRKDEVRWEEGIYSGQVLANPVAPSCALELSVVYTGSNVGNASSVNAYGCCSICMKTAGCGAFSWTDLNGGTCYLKSAKGDAQPLGQFVSSVI
ncbi:hypothetical protein PHYPSEUDO_003507 [Phytophthora pseudosyringae]|uniref:Apple domain-containing protein n=1 Tax=Phytophthora pseudosyringae TaxID=221518 RepID=A0A8T1VQI6_9STRA|nr:hypothetical protein PHYPSEUDO_003507 [Phytophthora pseudosyringae]